jgi:hypothetical protein
MMAAVCLGQQYSAGSFLTPLLCDRPAGSAGDSTPSGTARDDSGRGPAGGTQLGAPEPSPRVLDQIRAAVRAPTAVVSCGRKLANS